MIRLGPGKLYIAPPGTGRDDHWTYIGEYDIPAADTWPVTPGETEKGIPETFYIAECQVCTPRMPLPFWDPARRTDWIVAHQRATGHTVKYRTETR